MAKIKASDILDLPEDFQVLATSVQSLQRDFKQLTRNLDETHSRINKLVEITRMALDADTTKDDMVNKFLRDV